MTGLSRAQVTRLIRQYQECGEVKASSIKPAKCGGTVFCTVCPHPTRELCEFRNQRAARNISVGLEWEGSPCMRHPCGPGASARIPVELVEADFEIAFNLVDMAETEASLGDRARASRAIDDAEEVFRDIETRLLRLGTPGSQPFTPLVGELRREIDLALAHMG